MTIVQTPAADLGPATLAPPAEGTRCPFCARDRGSHAAGLPDELELLRRFVGVWNPVQPQKT